MQDSCRHRFHPHEPLSGRDCARLCPASRRRCSQARSPHRPSQAPRRLQGFRVIARQSRTDHSRSRAGRLPRRLRLAASSRARMPRSARRLPRAPTPSSNYERSEDASSYHPQFEKPQFRRMHCKPECATTSQVICRTVHAATRYHPGHRHPREGETRVAWLEVRSARARGLCQGRLVSTLRMADTPSRRGRSQGGDLAHHDRECAC